MQLPRDLAEKYHRPERDIDAEQFWDAFDLTPPQWMIDVGCNDSYVANILSDLGHDVTGVDLRPYGAGGQGPLTHGCNYRFIQSDFGEAERFLWDETFDVAVSLSAIEHFGLGTYGERKERPELDCVAMAQIWRILKPGGLAYITVPYAEKYVVWRTDWRVYDHDALLLRIVQKFEVVEQRFFVSQGINVGTFQHKPGDVLTREEADAAPVYPPHVTTLLVLRKVIDYAQGTTHE